MDIEKLWELLHKERNTASLQVLPETFHEDVREYLKKLEDEKTEAGGERGRSELVEDEIRNARMKAEDIIQRRIGKIVKLASSGMGTLPKGMLEEEAKIFEGVKNYVEQGKERLFALLSSEDERAIKSEGIGEDEREEQKQQDDTETVEPSFKQAEQSDSAENDNQNEEMHIVRILEDIPTFMGIDGEIYNVGKEDVIMLPKTNAEILCRRGVAVRIMKKNKNKNTEARRHGGGKKDKTN
uniref:DNA replication complex GINS family protein n=1 Tax=Candidatus Methanophagaceae archaeon ANME-1 ERB6 TaxID=2759912 RepID=A0A7G9YUZ8_9EURY|nr:hypothetical protein PFGANNDM_00035 [Methanosarcinales archaeon ANME-1 ERB6]QNO51832.1 hypothetical protein FGALOIDC_00016 [Methanosarcinales archaeon ANME-1 ERB6]